MELRELKGVAEFIIGRESSDVRQLKSHLKWMEDLLETFGEFERENLLDGIQYCKERLAELPPVPCDACGVMS